MVIFSFLKKFLMLIIILFFIKYFFYYDFSTKINIINCFSLNDLSFSPFNDLRKNLISKIAYIKFSSDSDEKLNKSIIKSLKKYGIDDGICISSNHKELLIFYILDLKIIPLKFVNDLISNKIFEKTKTYRKISFDLIKNSNNTVTLTIDYSQLLEKIEIIKISIFSKVVSSEILKSILPYCVKKNFLYNAFLYIFSNSLMFDYFTIKFPFFYQHSEFKKNIYKNLKDYLNVNGFLDAKVKINVKIIANECFVDIYIEEGIKYLIDSITIRDNTKLVNNYIKEEDNTLFYEKDKFYDGVKKNFFSEFKDKYVPYTEEKEIILKEKLQSFYRKFGYYDVMLYFVKIKKNIKKVNNQWCYITKLLIIIKKNQRYFVNRINIKGNLFIVDDVVRTCIYQNEQDWLNYNNLLESQNALLTYKYVTKVDFFLIKKKITSYKITKKYGKLNVVHTKIIFKLIDELERHSFVSRFHVTTKNSYVSLKSFAHFDNFFGHGCRIYSHGHFKDYYDTWWIDVFDPIFFPRYFFKSKLSEFRLGLNFYFKCGYLLKRYNNIIDYINAKVLNVNDFIRLKNKHLLFDNFIDSELCLTKIIAKFHIFKFGFGYSYSNIICVYDHDHMADKFIDYLNFIKTSNHSITCVFSSIYNSISDVNFPTQGFKSILIFRCPLITTFPFNIFSIEYEFYKFFSLTKKIIIFFSGFFKYANIYCFFKKDPLNIFPYYKNYKQEEFFFIRGYDEKKFGPSFYLKNAKKNIFIGGNIFYGLKLHVCYKFKILKFIDTYMKPYFFIDVGQLWNTNDYFVSTKEYNNFNTYLPCFSCGITFRFKNSLIRNVNEITFAKTFDLLPLLGLPNPVVYNEKSFFCFRIGNMYF